MALTKVSGDFIQDGSIAQGHLHASHGITTSDIGEGSNLYFTTARVNTAVGNLSTSDLSEGTNLYYTQARFDTAFAAKSTSNLSEGTNLYYTDTRVGSYLTTNSYATQSYVNTQVSNLVDSAPSTLDTLNELAAALGDDANFSTTVTNSIATKMPIAGGTFTGNVGMSGHLELFDVLYTRNALKVLNSAGTGWHTWATRAAGKYDLNVNNITAAAITASGNVTGANLNISNWDTAYGWGNHASAGYLTSYTETDTLATVTGRGASTSSVVTLTGGSKIVVQGGTDGGGSRGIFMWTNTDTNWGIYMSTPGSTNNIAGGTAPSGLNGETSHSIRFRIASGATNGFIWENHNNAALMSLRGSAGDLITSSSMRAPIFYDSNNTGYYVDPANTTTIRKTNIVASGSGWNDGLNLYSSDATNRWNLLVDDGAADAFRIAYNSSDRLYFHTSGQVNASGVLSSSTDMRAPIFYDSNNTGCYLDPASRSNFVSLDLNSGAVWDPTTQGTSKGSLHIDPDSGTDHAGGSITWGASDASSGTNAQAGIYVRSDGSYGTRMYLSTTDSYATGSKTTIRLEAAGGLYVDRGNFYSPAFYDLNNTGYYINPDGLSYIYQIRSNSAQANPRYDTAFYVLQAQHWYGDNGSQTMFLGENGNAIHVRGSMLAPIYYDYNDTGYYLHADNLSHLHSIDFSGILSGSGAGAQIGRNHAYDTLELKAYGAELMIGGQHSDLHINYRTCNNGAGGHTPTTWYWRAGSSSSWSNHYFGLIQSSSSVRGPIFYDSNNTGYYFDGDGTTNANQLTATRIGVNPSGSGTTQYGISLYGGYSSGEPTYGLLFTGTSGLGGHGGISGNWSTYFTMNNDTTRGWIFRRVGSGNVASISGSGLAQFDDSVRSQIFYDSNDTNYFIDPRTATNGFKFYSAAGPFFLRGQTHWDSQPGIDLSGGTSEFRFSSTGGNLNLRTDGWFIAHDYVRSLNQMYATILYDENNTGYYVDPASTSNVNVINASGECNFTKSTYPMFVYGNGSTAGSSAVGLQVYSSGGNGAIMAFHRGGYYAINMGLDSDNVFRIGGWSASSNRWTLDMSGNTVAAGSHRAPIFYDSNNTSYYVDPYSTSNLNTTNTDTANWSYGRTGSSAQSNIGLNLGTNASIYMCQSTYSSGAYYQVINDTATPLRIRHQVSSFDTTSYTDSIVIFNHNYWRGYVGILRSPEYPLDLNGQARLSGGYTTSDVRLKKNIRDNELGLSHLLQLRTRLFDWITDEEILGRTLAFQNSLLNCRGFIAQEVEEVVPELVDTSEGDQPTKSIDDGAVTAMMVKAIQEQQAIIDDLKARIEILENQ